MSKCLLGSGPKDKSKLRGSLLRPRQRTPHRESTRGKVRTYPSDRSTKVEPRNNGVWRTSTRRGRRQILLGRYHGHGQCHGDGYLARPFEYNTDSGPRYCKRMSDIAWKKNPYQWHGRELSCAWVTLTLLILNESYLWKLWNIVKWIHKRTHPIL